VPTSNRGRPYHHGDLRAALIAEALRVLADGGGVAALSLRDLARRLGVSHAAPYRHFPDLDALLAAIAEEGFGRLTAALERAAASRPGPVEQLAEAGWAYVRFALEHPHYFRVMFSGRLADAPASPALRAAGRRAFGVLLRCIAAGQAAGELAGGPADEPAAVAWAQVHGLATLLLDRQLAPDDGADVEARVRRASQILIAGLGQQAHA
jgi:AcrR family transcriptional regulator